MIGLAGRFDGITTHVALTRRGVRYSCRACLSKTSRMSHHGERYRPHRDVGHRHSIVTCERNLVLSAEVERFPGGVGSFGTGLPRYTLQPCAEGQTPPNG